MLPQTLQIACMLFYINAVFGVLFGSAGSLIGVGIILAEVASGLGIANSFRWGYQLGVLVAAVNVLVLLALAGGPILLTLINLVFPVALLALLLHKDSRGYQRIWFE